MHQENIKLLNVNAPTAQNYKMREAKSIRLKSEIKGALIHRWWACKLRNHYGKQHRASSKTKNGSATRPGELPSGHPPGKHVNPDPQTYTRRDVRSGTARGGQDRETSEMPAQRSGTHAQRQVAHPWKHDTSIRDAPSKLSRQRKRPFTSCWKVLGGNSLTRYGRATYVFLNWDIGWP